MTHNLAVEEVLLDQHYVDSLGLLKREEAEAARTTRGRILHDGAVYHLAVLAKVTCELLCDASSDEGEDESVGVAYVRLSALAKRCVYAL